MTISTETGDFEQPGGLFSGYLPLAGVYDEMLGPEGRVRGTWEQFAQGLSELGPVGLAQRADQTRRLLRENGVTYNVAGAPQGPDRPWELDALPLLLSQTEWNRLSSALEQRARLLNQILADLYGPQDLLHRGLLPADLVYGHPGFLRACHGLRVPGNVFLHLYAAHLARQSDGQWRVLADRTQGPSGAGYAVENRVVLSRILPVDFHRLQVERLAPFFIALRETLLSSAPLSRDNPHVVLLSPGPRSATYFEDAYLARYLGYTLVEGGDLTVRGDRVLLKTLGGLLPVDVILRRVPDEDADPLELKPGSQLGVPGLVHAVRKGKVVVANSLGSGFLEAPALLPFLPAICRHYYSEDLLLPSVDTWWCGRPEDLRYVESRFDELIVRPAFLHRSAPPVVVRQLPRGERSQLLEQIRRQPDRYAAQSEVVRSTAPVWSGDRLLPWHVGVRAFAVAHRGKYSLLAGGLSRVSSTTDSLGESMSAGQRSKDVWVLSDRPVARVSLLQAPAKAVELRRSANDLPSRVADNLFWLGRHVERAEGMVRHIRSIVVRMTQEIHPSGIADLIMLMTGLSDSPLTLPQGEQTPPVRIFDFLRDEVIDFLFDSSRPAGLPSTLSALRGTASIVRDRLSVDAWRIVNQMDLDLLFPRGPDRNRLGDLAWLLNQLLNLLSAFSGLVTESMTRGAGWRFLDMGRRIERAMQILRLVRRLFVEPRADLLPALESALEVADSSMTYRYRYLTTLQLPPVLDLLLVDETNPRAVGFQVAALASHVRALTVSSEDTRQNSEQRILLGAQAALRLTDVEALAVQDVHGRRTRLDQFLEDLGGAFPQLSDSLTHTYLTHTVPSRQLTGMAHNL